jgi:glutaredoxin
MKTKSTFILILFLGFWMNPVMAQDKNSPARKSNKPVIEIYTSETCQRCKFSLQHLKTRGIEFVEFKTELEENKSRMWELVRNSGKYKAGSITMPVIVKDGEVFFSIENLEKFLKKL